jgi:enoyl-CoA hydratase/carnithine racemase
VSDPTTLTLTRPREGVAQITLNRPEKLNALNATMFDELRETAQAVGRDRSVRAVVLTGAGRAFCPGFDLADAPALAELTSGEMLDFQERAAGVVEAIHAVPQPVIAAVNGACVGGGLSIALASDVRIAAENAKFSAIFVRGGFSAGDLGCTWFLPRIVGLGVAAELITTARTVLADEALRIGLVSHVHPADALLDAALDTATTIAANAPLGVRMSLRALYANVDAPSLRTALELENRGQAMLSPGPDVREALAAARDGRAPRFAD